MSANKPIPAPTTPAPAVEPTPASQPSAHTEPVRNRLPVTPAGPSGFRKAWNWMAHNRATLWGWFWRLGVALFAFDNITRVILGWDILPGMSTLYASVSLGLAGLLGNDAGRVGAMLFFGEAVIFIAGLYLNSSLLKRLLPHKEMKFRRVPAPAVEPTAPVVESSTEEPVTTTPAASNNGRKVIKYGKGGRRGR